MTVKVVLCVAFAMGLAKAHVHPNHPRNSTKALEQPVFNQTREEGDYYHNTVQQIQRRPGETNLPKDKDCDYFFQFRNHTSGQIILQDNELAKYIKLFQQKHNASEETRRFFQPEYNPDDPAQPIIPIGSIEIPGASEAENHKIDEQVQTIKPKIIGDDFGKPRDGLIIDDDFGDTNQPINIGRGGQLRTTKLPPIPEEPPVVWFSPPAVVHDPIPETHKGEPSGPDSKSEEAQWPLDPMQTESNTDSLGPKDEPKIIEKHVVENLDKIITLAPDSKSEEAQWPLDPMQTESNTDSLGPKDEPKIPQKHIVESTLEHIITLAPDFKSEEAQWPLDPIESDPKLATIGPKVDLTQKFSQKPLVLDDVEDKSEEAVWPYDKISRETSQLEKQETKQPIRFDVFSDPSKEKVIIPKVSPFQRTTAAPLKKIDAFKPNVQDKIPRILSEEDLKSEAEQAPITDKPKSVRIPLERVTYAPGVGPIRRGPFIPQKQQPLDVNPTSESVASKETLFPSPVKIETSLLEQIDVVTARPQLVVSSTLAAKVENLVKKHGLVVDVVPQDDKKDKEQKEDPEDLVDVDDANDSADLI